MTDLELLQKEFPKVNWEYDSYCEVYEGKVNNTLVSFCNVNCPDIYIEVTTNDRKVLKYLNEDYCLIYLNDIKTLSEAISKLKCYLQETNKIVQDLL